MVVLLQHRMFIAWFIGRILGDLSSMWYYFNASTFSDSRHIYVQESLFCLDGSGVGSIEDGWQSCMVGFGQMADLEM